MEDLGNLINGLIDSDIKTKEGLREQATLLLVAALQIDRSFWKGGKLLIFGNGGSAADSQHIAAEFIGRFSRNRKALPAIALTTDTSILTAVSNDFGFEHIFERQVEALCHEEDTVIGISTSGESENVVRGIVAAKRIGAYTIALQGIGKTRLSQVADLTIRADSRNTADIQQSHILIGHIFAELVEKRFVGGMQGELIPHT